MLFFIPWNPKEVGSNSGGKMAKNKFLSFMSFTLDYPQKVCPIIKVEHSTLKDLD